MPGYTHKMADYRGAIDYVTSIHPMHTDCQLMLLARCRYDIITVAARR